MFFHKISKIIQKSKTLFARRKHLRWERTHPCVLSAWREKIVAN